MKQLIYMSRPAQKFTSEGLAAILAIAQPNNQSKQITGALLFDDYFFVQLLEGPSEAVDELFDKIKHDSRHDYVVTLAERPLEFRSCSDWSMRGIEFPRETKKLGEFALLTLEFWKQNSDNATNTDCIFDWFSGLTVVNPKNVPM